MFEENTTQTGVTYSDSAPSPPPPFDAGNWGQLCHSFDQIKNCHIPNRGPDTWRPLPHETFVGMIEQALDRHGFRISEPLHYRAAFQPNKKIADGGQWGRFISLYGISHNQLPTISGINWECGAVNSYDMTKSAGLGLGRRVQVCSNGLFMGSSHEFRRKHTTGIDRGRDGIFQHIYDLVNSNVEGLLANAQEAVSKIETYQNTGCSDTDARWIIMEAAKKNVIGAAATMKVLENWETPPHPEFTDRNVWSLENAFTENAKGKSLFTQGEKFGRLDGIFNDRFGFGEDEILDAEVVASNF